MKAIICIVVLLISICAVFIHSNMEKSERRMQSKETGSTIESAYEKIDECPSTRFCEMGGCFERGTEAVIGASGSFEYYCPAHFEEITTARDETKND